MIPKDSSFIYEHDMVSGMDPYVPPKPYNEGSWMHLQDTFQKYFQWLTENGIAYRSDGPEPRYDVRFKYGCLFKFQTEEDRLMFMLRFGNG